MRGQRNLILQKLRNVSFYKKVIDVLKGDINSCGYNLLKRMFCPLFCIFTFLFASQKLQLLFSPDLVLVSVKATSDLLKEGLFFLKKILFRN